MIFVMLHNVRSAHNVGSVFRTADGAGVSRIYLTGYTPAPVDRFGRAQPEIEKTSLGASQSVPWEQHADIFTLIENLKAEGVAVVAVEQHERAIDYRSFTLQDDTVFIFGNEVDGVPAGAIEKADAVVSLPMRGKKESLNVAIAAGIILYQYVDDR